MGFYFEIIAYYNNYYICFFNYLYFKNIYNYIKIHNYLYYFKLLIII